MRHMFTALVLWTKIGRFKAQTCVCEAAMGRLPAVDAACLARPLRGAAALSARARPAAQAGRAATPGRRRAAHPGRSGTSVKKRLVDLSERAVFEVACCFRGSRAGRFPLLAAIRAAAIP